MAEMEIITATAIFLTIPSRASSIYFIAVISTRTHTIGLGYHVHVAGKTQQRSPDERSEIRVS